MQSVEQYGLAATTSENGCPLPLAGLKVSGNGRNIEADHFSKDWVADEREIMPGRWNLVLEARYQCPRFAKGWADR